MASGSRLLVPARRQMYKQWYELLARRFRRPDWTYMNYGYAPLEGELGAGVGSSDPDADLRCFSNLYERVVAGVTIDQRDVVEIGCGRGGGSVLLKRIGNPARMCGVDLAQSSVELCRQVHGASGVEFEVGDAEALPFADATFDVAVNVESSHCYSSTETFAREAFRILRPGGTLAWTDFRPAAQMPATIEAFRSAGFRVAAQQDITENVLRALAILEPRKKEFAVGQVPKFLRGRFSRFAGGPGSPIHTAFASREKIYLAARFDKPIGAELPS